MVYLLFAACLVVAPEVREVDDPPARDERTFASRISSGQDVAPPGPEADEDPFGVQVRVSPVWAYTWGTASARNSFTRYERGEDLDLHDDFGLDRGAALLDSALDVRFARRHRAALHSLFGNIAGSAVLDRTFEYNDNVFHQGEHAETRLELDLRDVDYAYRFAEDRSLTFWAGAGFRWSHLNIGIRSSTLDPAGSMEENTAIFPTLNVGVDYVAAPSLRVVLEVRGSPAAVPILFSHPSLGRFIEVRAALGWSVTDFIRVDAGGTFFWTWQRWRGREEDGHYAVNYVDIKVAGPSIGVVISF